jgi:hypothetical protein
LRTLVALIGIAGVLGTVAYGATRLPQARLSRAAHSDGPGAERLPRPRITAHPEAIATSATAVFAFASRGPTPRFECRLDGGRWRGCRSPVELAALAAGGHAFGVRVADRRGRHGRSARFRWTLLEPRPFAIAPRLAELGPLYPGAPPAPLPLTLTNPNPVPIFVTSLRVSAGAGPAGCAAENLALGEGGASEAAPLQVPAGGSVSLPEAGIPAPTIQLRDLAVDQDACQGASFPLEFFGSARG